MPGSYSLDLRTRIVGAYHNGEGTVRELAERFCVANGTVQNYLRLERTTGQLAPKPQPGRVSRLTEKVRAQLSALVEEKNDRTGAELCAELRRRSGVHVSTSWLSRILSQMGVTRKKNATRHRARPPRSASAAVRVPPKSLRASRGTADFCR